MSLLSDNFFFLLFFFLPPSPKNFFSCQSENETMMPGVCICEILCICVCIVQPERDTLEEKPFILPTDSPVSALTARIY